MPAFSFSKQQKTLSFLKFDKSVPNVGKYDLTPTNFNSRTKTAPSVSLPKASRDTPDKRIVPGPGAYHTDSVDSKSASKGPSMIGTHELKIKTEGPSPGQYDPKVQFPTKKFSFSKSTEKKLTPKGPDPGTYSVNYEIMNTTSNYVFSKSERQPWQKKSWMKNVAPGYTEVKQKLIIEQRNQFSFPKRQKFKEDALEIKEKSIVPGPGKYDIHNARDSRKSVKFALASKTIATKSQAPGPGAYQVPDKFESCKASVAIGNCPRQTNYTTLTPGPGTYEIENMVKLKSKEASTAVFSKQERLKSYTTSLTVGPGQYEVPSEIERVSNKKGITIKGKILIEKIEKTPGPQAYEPDYRKVYCSAQSSLQLFGYPRFGKQRKIFTKSNNNPGPGSYEPKQKVFAKTFYFNKARSNSLQIKKDTSNIGPGQYKLKPFIGQFDGRKKMSTKNQTIYV